jgi:hypothetical protein
MESSIAGKFTNGSALAFVSRLIELHEGPGAAYLLALLDVTEAPNFEPLFELDGLLHGRRTRGLGQLHVLPVFLVQEVEKFRFLPGTHQKIFIHFRVLRLDPTALLLGKVGDVAGIHFDCSLDGSLLLEVLS